MQLPQTLTLEVAGTAVQAMQLSQGGDGLVIDASTLQVFDTAALAVLLQAMRLARSQGQAFSVHGAPPKLTQLAQLYGVAELLALAPAR
jgi:phospholipid transport system transporter-binding protein